VRERAGRLRSAQVEDGHGGAVLLASD